MAASRTRHGGLPPTDRSWTHRLPADAQEGYGITNVGFLTVDTLGDALVAAATGVVLIPVMLLLARWCAATHAALAVRMLT
jgi:hypothetical protein